MTRARGTHTTPAERAVAVIEAMDADNYMVKIYGVIGRKRRLAVTARGGLAYAQRIAVAYCGVKETK